jgi:hypothetical protein
MRTGKPLTQVETPALTQERGVPQVEQLRPEVGVVRLQRGD